MLRFVAGCVFMTVVFCVWLSTRFFPQYDLAESRLIQCRIDEKAMAGNIVEVLKNVRRND